jgi:hypothetical protein
MEAASHQLDWAIRLFLDHNAPLPAITLAGAAEEILGANLADKSAFQDLVRHFTTTWGIDQKILSQQHLNKARNWLKHWSTGTDAEYEDFELEEEAIQYIARGLTNMAANYQSLPHEGPRFLEWVKANRRLPNGPKQFVQADPASWRRPRACATLARVRHPATGRLNSSVRCP